MRHLSLTVKILYDKFYYPVYFILFIHIIYTLCIFIFKLRNFFCSNSFWLFEKVLLDLCSVQRREGMNYLLSISEIFIGKVFFFSYIFELLLFENDFFSKLYLEYKVNCLVFFLRLVQLFRNLSNSKYILINVTCQKWLNFFKNSSNFEMTLMIHS